MTQARRGRPRSAAVHDAILDATRAMLIEHGYGEVSMDRVAERAGVGVQSVYRRWPSKAPLIAEAVMKGSRQDGTAEAPDTGEIAGDLRAWLRRMAAYLEEPGNAALLRSLAAAAAENPEDGKAFYRELTGYHHEALLRRLHQAVAAGQVRANVDLESVADAIFGAALYRILTYAPIPGDTVKHFDGLVDALITGVGADPDAAAGMR